MFSDVHLYDIYVDIEAARAVQLNQGVLVLELLHLVFTRAERGGVTGQRQWDGEVFDDAERGDESLGDVGELLVVPLYQLHQLAELVQVKY